MTDPVLLLAALLTGLAGAGHCFGMCAGIAGALVHSVPAGTSTGRFILAFSAGRVATYAALGVIAGSAAALVSPGDAGIAMAVARVVAGLLMLAVGLYLLRAANLLAWLERVGGIAWRRLAPLARRVVPVTTIPRALAAGALWGMLPCGLVYGALLFAATSGSAFAGAATMLAFGTGTLPAVLALGAATGWLRQHASGLRHASGVLMLAWGVWTIAATWLALPAILDGTCRSPGDVMSYAISALMHINELPGR